MGWNRLEEAEMGWLGLESNEICCNKLENVDNDVDNDNDADEDDDGYNDDEWNGMVFITFLSVSCY